MEESETKIEGIEVRLLSEDGKPVTDIYDNTINSVKTDSSGNYKFSNLKIGNYIVKLANNESKLTEKNIGINEEINSKFNSNGETDIITSLDNVDQANLIEKYVNVGLLPTSAQVIVHHYLEETGEEYGNKAVILSPNVTIDATIGSQYSTTVGDEVEEKYELVETPANATGTVDSEKIDVYYYYRLKEPSITDEAIVKTSNTVQIDNVNDTVSYTIEYTVKVDQYEGDAEVTLVDILPYKLDTLANGTSLDGGTYDEEAGTITWTERIEEIDTYTERETREITITKNITVKYADIDITQENIVNSVTGKVELETPEKKSDGVEDTAETAQSFKVDVEVEKIWEDSEDVYGERPESLTIILKKADGKEVGRHTLDVARGERTYIFTGLDRYDENGYEIEYTVAEEVTGSDSLEDYTAKIGEIENIGGNSKKITITNRLEKIPAKVIVKYLEKGTEEELAKQENINGYVGEEYKTEQKEIDGYIFEEIQGIPEGKMTEDTIEVIYYYVKEGRVIVKHIDEETGEVLLEEPIYGKVGETVETEAKNFEGYVLVKSPEEIEVEIEEEEKVVTYYYVKVSGGVLEKHIDDITGELLYSELHEGDKGDIYKIESKKFEGYELVEDKLPINSEGEMTEELIEVTYYYRKPVGITVEYVDKETGEKIAENEIIAGYKGEEYTTEQKEIDGYTFVEVDGEKEGIMSDDTTVTYYYEQAEKISEPVENTTDNTIANGVLPQTGEKVGIKSLLVVLSVIIITIIVYKKNIEYRDIH